MSKSMELVKIDINIDENELFINECSTIRVSIKNKSNLKIENGFVRLIIDEKIFKITNEQIKPCINKFANIGNINPDKTINIDIPVEVVSIPKKGLSKVFCDLDYHTIKNGELIDESCKSEEFTVRLLEMKILNQDQFKITTSKSEYFFDESIDFDITIKNEDVHTLKNLVISNFIPKNTRLIPKSISTSKPNKTIINQDNIAIKELIEQEEMHIRFSINSLSPRESIESIENRAHLKYIVNDKKVVECDSPPITVKLKYNNLFDTNSFIYKIDKEEVLINDIITHTVIIKNRIGTPTRNLSIKSNLIKKLEFVENSLTVNDIHRIGEEINNEVKLGELEPYEDLVLSYKTKVLDVFDYININTLLSYDTPRRTLTQESNYVKLKVMSHIFNRENFTKKSDKESYLIGDIVTFTIDLLNSGTLPGNDINLKDTLDRSLEFIPSSVVVNNNRVSSDITKEGVTLNNVLPNKKLTIQYQAKAIDINRDIRNNATITYRLKGVEGLRTLYTNSTSIKVLGAKIGNNNFTKELSSYTAKTGDIITVKLLIENRGNIKCENLMIQEPINTALEFVEGSLIVNNKDKMDGNIFNGITFSKLQEDESLILTYQMRVLGFPKPNPIDDRAILTYTCLNNSKIENKTIYSTKTKLYVHSPELEIIDKNSFLDQDETSKYCHCNDYVFYNLILDNRGNVSLENVYLGFKFPDELSIDFKTLKINNLLYQRKQESNILLPDLGVSQKITIEFYAKHNFKDNYNLESFVYLNYVFKDLKSKQVFRQCKTLKENVIVINPKLDITKFILDKDIEISREFTKNINIKNSGNVRLENLTLNLNEPEFLRNNDKTVFINGSYCENANNLTINSVNIDETVNIAIRYNINAIPASQVVIPESDVTATYQLNNDFSPMIIRGKSNPIVLDIKNYLLKVSGKCNYKTLLLNNISTYMFQITNLGNINCDALKLNLNLPDYIDYIDNTFSINGKRFNIKKINSPIHLDGLNYNETLNISFDFTISKLPYKKQAKIDAVVYAKYDSGEDIVNRSFKSNDNLLDVESIELDMVKTLSSDALQSGDTLKVQTIINNVGSVDIYDLVLKDNYESSLLFKEDSVYIDGEHIINLDPTVGIKLRKLSSGKNILISYEYEYIPKVHLNKITHYSDLQYVYNFLDSKKESGSLKSEVMYIEGLLSTFKQFSIENEYILKDYEPSIDEIVGIFSQVKIEDYYEINTIKSKSIDNSSATGKKVIIKGLILDRVEYLTSEENTPLYMLERGKSFTVFVNLPNDYDSDDLYFKARCDDTFYKTTGSRGVFISSLISIEGLA